MFGHSTFGNFYYYLKFQEPHIQLCDPRSYGTEPRRIANRWRRQNISELFLSTQRRQGYFLIQAIKMSSNLLRLWLMQLHPFYFGLCQSVSHLSAEPKWQCWEYENVVDAMPWVSLNPQWWALAFISEAGMSHAVMGWLTWAIKRFLDHQPDHLSHNWAPWCLWE